MGLYGHLAPVPVDVEVTAREGGRVQLRVAGVKVKLPAAIAYELADSLVSAAEHTEGRKQ